MAIETLRCLSGVEGSGVEGSGVEGNGVEGSGVEDSGVEGTAGSEAMRYFTFT